MDPVIIDCYNMSTQYVVRRLSKNHGLSYNKAWEIYYDTMLHTVQMSLSKHRETIKQLTEMKMNITTIMIDKPWNTQDFDTKLESLLQSTFKTEKDESV